ncbi:MAG: NADH-quinone oxidoreductase, chain [Actinomycetia bacterium]|nr:NADH-quinone oxidoreductase, chain [Actinomycetes bacterium]
MTTGQAQTDTELVTLTIDGREVQARKGELLIKVAQENGVYIPRFCWHERMEPVGMCRMCLVQVDGMRGFPPACTTPVAEGMVAHTDTEPVKKIQDGVLEFLLINHPLDCPVCDRGGECPLQDQTLAFGPGESRFTEEKRHFEKPIPLSGLVLLDRERCIQCGRCTRFAEEIAGDPLIDFGERSDRMQVVTFPDEPFSSYFSGNTVQICPVGALLSKPYRFKARPWDLSTSETTCTTCAVGCRGALQSSSNRLLRLLGVDLDAVNQGWLCDKGRYGYEWVHADERVLEPSVRVRNAMVDVSWPEALEAVANELQRAIELHGPSSVAVLGGARGSNEDAYAWVRLAKGVIGTDNVDAQLGDGLPADAVLGLPRAEIDDLDQAAAIVLLGPDLKEELPVLYLRVKQAAVSKKVPLLDLAPVDVGLTPYATAVSRTVPGEEGVAAERLVAAIGGRASGDAGIDAFAAAATGRSGPVVVVLGRGSVAQSAAPTMRAAAAFAALPNVRFLSALRRGNVHGALDLGLAPGFLPGRVTLDAGRGWFAPIWQTVPKERGLDAEGILRAAADGKVRVLVLLGADPVADFPDTDLARRAIDGAGYVVAVDAFLSESTRRADAFLPCTVWGEKAGTTTNLEGRVQRLGRKVSPEGTTMDDWRIAGELAVRLGNDFDLEFVDEVTDEIATVAPAHAGARSQLLRRSRDGVVLPVREHLHEIMVRTGDLNIMAEDGPAVSWDPIRVDAAEPSEEGDAAHEVDEARGEAERLEREAPAHHEWDRAANVGDAPGRDAYALRLVSGRELYDGGRITTCSPSLAPLRKDSALMVHPQDLARIGVEEGTQVRVTSSRATVTLPVRTHPSVPAGTARLPFTADGRGASELIDTTTMVTDLRVETIS